MKLTETFKYKLYLDFLKLGGNCLIVLKYKRKKSIYQMQVTDYMFGLRKSVFIASIPNERLKALKLLTSVPRKKKRKRGRKKDILESFYKITYFIKKGDLTEIRPQYLMRFREVAILPESEINYEGIGKVDKLMIKSLQGFTGFFEYLIYCNNFTYFDELQIKLEDNGISFKNRFLNDIIIHELARIQIGIDNYTAYMNAIRFMRPLFLKNISRDPDYFPNVDIVSHALRIIPLKFFKAFFYNLLEEAFEFNIVKTRILVWDCQFVHSNSSDQFNKEKGSYNDPDAGFCKHNGKIYGVGYKVSTIYAFCGNRYIPVYCELFPGNQDEYSVFQLTFLHYFALGYCKPLIVLSDAGPYSLENLRFLFDMGIIPLINAKKNIKNQNVKKLKDYFYVNMDFIPESWTDEEIILLMNIRSGIERQFSHNIVVYHARRANVRGIEMVSKHRFMILILDLLKINTAYKIGRSDWIGKCRIFITTKRIDFDSIFPQLATQQGYQILLPNYNRRPAFFRMR